MNILVIGMCGNSLFYNKESNTLLKEEPGGKGYNQAVGISKLGGTVSFIGAIGNDQSGIDCSKYLESVRVNNLLIKKETNTTFATIHVDKCGNNYINVSFGAKLDYSDIEYIKKQIMRHDVILLQNEIDVNLNKEIIDYAYSLNKLIIMNPAPIAPWVKEYLNKLTLVTPNEEEARVLFNIPDNITYDLLGNYLIKKSINNALITLGDKGALLIKNGYSTYFNSLKVKAIDTTGAGDLMNACIAYGLSRNISIDDAIKLGIVACGYSVQRKFVLESYPFMKDIKEKIKL